jgi:hypothetical protein
MKSHKESMQRDPPALQNSSLPHFVQSSKLLVWVTFLSPERKRI